MKKRMKSLISMMLAAAMIFSLTACGSSDTGASGSEADTQAAAETESAATDGGKVLNIWCWNDEFQSRFNA
jgi:uncharacterized lipoprotein YehR (DUF1307 family)